MAPAIQSPKDIRVRESDVELKWKIRLFWILVSGFLATAVVLFSLPSRVPNHLEFGFAYLGLAVLMLAVTNKLRKRRIEQQSEVQELEGDGGRQRT